MFKEAITPARRATTRDCPNGYGLMIKGRPYHCRGNPLWLPCPAGLCVYPKWRKSEWCRRAASPPDGVRGVPATSFFLCRPRWQNRQNG